MHFSKLTIICEKYSVELRNALDLTKVFKDYVNKHWRKMYPESLQLF